MGMSNGRVFSLNIDNLAVTQEFSVQGEVVGLDRLQVRVYSSSPHSEVQQKCIFSMRIEMAMMLSMVWMNSPMTHLSQQIGDGVGDSTDWAPIDDWAHGY